MTIRHVTMDDIERIIAIEFQNFSVEEASTIEAFHSHIRHNSETFLVAEIAGEIAGFIEGPVIEGEFLTDDLFQGSLPNPKKGGTIAVTSLAIAKEHQGQGVGTALIAALKDVAVAQERQGITLTCHDYLIPYYEMNGFKDNGLSASTHGGATWYNMTWECP
ncbi:GNAT family N-acetyltransferase [Streptococcus rifensis]